MDECRMAGSMLMADVSGGRVRGRPTLGSRGMTVEAARQYVKIGRSGEPWHICSN